MIDGARPGGEVPRATTAWRPAARALAALGDLAVPLLCGGCGAPGTPWCPTCGAALARATGSPRIVGGRAGAACSPDGPVVAAGRYEGIVREALVGFKDHGRRDLLDVLASPLRAAILTALAVRPDTGVVLPVVPAPSSARSRRERGDVPTHLLVRRALVGLDVLTGRACVWAPVLRHGRPVGDQVGLTRAARARNTDHAFTLDVRAVRALGGLAGRDLLVVDDVVTSGATARECVRVLREAGGRPVAVAALAATPAHPDRPRGRDLGRHGSPADGRWP